MTRIKKRKVRTTTIRPVRSEYEDNTLTLTEYRDGVEYRVRVVFSPTEHWAARDVAKAARKHVASVVDYAKRRLQWAADALAGLGGQS